MKRHQSLRASVLLCGVAGAALAWGAAGAALAQAQPGPAGEPDAAAGTAEVEAVVVTGTQIRGVAPVGANVISVNSENIVKSGLPTTVEVLRSIPQIVNVGTDQRSTGRNLGRGSGINLRGLGNSATLVLIDGHRAAPGGIDASFIDPSSIPTLALGGVEVLADGASAIYGSDAVAGVVNLILRKNYEGVEVQARYGVADHFWTQRYGAALGHRWDSGSLTVAVEKYLQAELRTSDRPKLYQNVAAPVSLQPNSGGLARGIINFTPLANIRVGSTYYAVGPNRTVTPNAQNVQGQEAVVFPGQNRDSVTIVGNQQIGERFELYGQGFYTNRHFKIQNTQGVNLTLTVPSTNPYFLPVPGATNSETVLVQLPINSLHQTGRQSDWQAVLGGKARLPFDWEADVSVSEAGSSLFGPTSAGNGTVVNNCALGITTLGCAGVGALQQTDPARAFNPFGPNSPSVINSIVTDGGGARSRYVIRDLTGKLDGELFSLPAGPVRAALGAEYQKHTFDFLNLSGQGAPAIGTYRASPDNASMTVKSVFGEVVVPVLAEGSAIGKLDLSAAVRYDKYSRLDQGTTNPKLGFTWRPVEDLSFKGSYGTSFRYSLTSADFLNARAVNVLPSVADFRSPTGQTIAIRRSGGNPALKPETAKTFTFGTQYRPSYFRGFSAELTYFNVKYDNIIGMPDPGSVGSAQIEQLYSQFLERRPSDPAGSAAYTAKVDALLNSGFLINNPVNPSTVNLIFYADQANIGLLKTSGLDFVFSYNWQMGESDFVAGLSGTYYFNFKRAIVPGAPLTSQLRRSNFPQRYRLRGQLGWNRGGLSVNAYVNHTPGYLDTLVTPNTLVDSYTTVDLTVAYDLGDRPRSKLLKNVRFSIDALDLFDQDPPRALTTATTADLYDANVASPVGRIVSFEIRKRF
jgi:iron complex outermembrane receptor protein